MTICFKVLNTVSLLATSIKANLFDLWIVADKARFHSALLAMETTGLTSGPEPQLKLFKSTYWDKYLQGKYGDITPLVRLNSFCV